MVRLNVELTQDTLALARDRAASHGFTSVEQYLHSLLLEDLQAIDERELEALLLKRLESDEWVEMDKADFAYLQSEAEKAIAEARQSK